MKKSFLNFIALDNLILSQNNQQLIKKSKVYGFSNLFIIGKIIQHSNLAILSRHILIQESFNFIFLKHTYDNSLFNFF